MASSREAISSTQYAHPEALVTTEWVAEHQRDTNVRLIEVDVDTSAYEQGHIPGAIGWHFKKDLQDTVTRDIISKDKLEQLLGRAGIDRDTTIILYGDSNNWFAAFAYWVLKYYGHRDVRLMNGGRVKWLAEKRALTTEPASHTPRRYTASDPDLSVRAFKDYILTAINARAGIGLVDVRSPREYSGELLAPENLPQEGAQRGGHIPGASNIPWSTAVNEDGTFKSAEQLREIYGAKGITPDKEIIAYCRIGERSAHTWFVLDQLLGYPKVRNYDGSWTEWGSAIGVPVER